jgi:hypothetical protein
MTSDMTLTCYVCIKKEKNRSTSFLQEKIGRIPDLICTENNVCVLSDHSGNASGDDIDGDMDMHDLSWKIAQVSNFDSMVERNDHG